jgi:hypothetical protein
MPIPTQRPYSKRLKNVCAGGISLNANLITTITKAMSAASFTFFIDAPPCFNHTHLDQMDRTSFHVFQTQPAIQEPPAKRKTETMGEEILLR